MATAERAISIGSTHKKSMNFLCVNSLTRWAVRHLGPFLVDTGTRATNFKLEALDQIKKYWTPDSLLLIVSNHQSHADFLAILQVIRKVREIIPDIGSIYLPISVTLENGRQSGISQTFYHEVAMPIFEQNSINPIYIVTPNDRTKRGVVQTREETLKDIDNIKRPTTEKNSAYFVLTEGTVDGGRHNQDGTIRGIVKVTSPFFRAVIEAARENNREVIGVPIGLNETYRMLSAEHVFLTLDGFKTIFRRILRRKIMTLADVTAGSPFIIGAEVNPRQLNDSIMRNHIAPLIPPETRGVYKDIPEKIPA